MTDLFKSFVLDVDESFGECENIIHFVDDDYNIITEYKGKILSINSDNLYSYYQIYTMGKKTYAQTVARTTAAITKIILQFFNLKNL